MKKDDICRACGGTGRNPNLDSCSMCGARMRFGTGKNKEELEVTGTNHHEVLKVMRELANEKNKPSILSLLINWSFLFGSLLAVPGVVLVIIGSDGEIEFSFFEQTFKSKNAGIAAVFLGSALIVLNVRRVLKSYDNMGKKYRKPS